MEDTEKVLLRIEQLLAYAEKQKLLELSDIEYSRNGLLHLFNLNEPLSLKSSTFLDESIGVIMEDLLDYGYSIGLIDHDSIAYRDLLDARIMGLLLPRPSQCIQTFKQLEAETDIQAATDYFYNLNMASRYIRYDRVQQNPNWLYKTVFGDLQMTINLSKPEKDPIEIARLKTLPQTHYPACLLCKENVGYAGRLDHPARQNLRVIPVELAEESWFLQYSPYVYYNEHSIVLSGEHRPMKIGSLTFKRLLDFVERYPHYFIGSNADLPIVGGSILNHDHYQAGRHLFPMEQAKVTGQFKSKQFMNVSLYTVNWPLSVIRLQSSCKLSLEQAATHVLQVWKNYSDIDQDILAETLNTEAETIQHNTVTPIARRKQDGLYELDLVLRNNRTTEEHPYGIFHPHEHLHHIKKENIGLIEVMGLAVLPARLKDELQSIVELLLDGNEALILATQQSGHHLYHHSEWITYLYKKFGQQNDRQKIIEMVYSEVGKKFLEVLDNAGVFKQNSAGIQGLKRFIFDIGYY